jgi:anti-anti-sigma factor
MSLSPASLALPTNNRESIEVRLEAQRVGAWDAEPVLDSLLELAHTGKGRELRLDLSDLEYVTSAGLGMFVSLNRAVTAAGGRLSLFNVRPTVYEVFALTRLTSILDVRAAA